MQAQLISLLESWGVNTAADEVAYLLAPGTIPFAILETIYLTVFATFFAYLIGLPLGIILVTGEAGGIRPLPRGLMRALNIIVNLLRSVPFTNLMVVCQPLARLIVGTSIGTTACIVSLTMAAAPFVPGWWRAPCGRWTTASSRPPRPWAALPGRSSPRS